jgi:hypothetical protein
MQMGRTSRCWMGSRTPLRHHSSPFLIGQTGEGRRRPAGMAEVMSVRSLPLAAGTRGMTALPLRRVAQSGLPDVEIKPHQDWRDSPPIETSNGFWHLHKTQGIHGPSSRRAWTSAVAFRCWAAIDRFGTVGEDDFGRLSICIILPTCM